MIKNLFNIVFIVVIVVLVIVYIDPIKKFFNSTGKEYARQVSKDLKDVTN